jgi:4-amino-4-deoxy-L-arabinose transferase-like glycosyltransferase
MALAWVGVLTVFGAVLRFWNLSSPGIWGDEAATYGRVNGTYWELLDVLQYDGFMPLHYQLYYVLARFLTLDPWLMRVWPAICGTLTVPSMYFLARQLTSRRTSVWVTLLAASSAYLLYYSRDAKMYAPVWLFVVLSMAFFLLWLNEKSGLRSRLGFWGWVFATTAAGGVHAPGLIVLAIQPLVYFAHPNRGRWLGLGSWKVPAFVLGVLISIAGPIAHYRFFSKWGERIEESGWNASMLQWVQWYNQGRALPELCRFTSTSFASAWEWPDKQQTLVAIEPWVLTTLKGFSIGLGAAVLLGCVPWARLFHLLQAGYRRWVRKVPPDEVAAAPAEGAPVPILPTRPGGWFAAFVLAAWIVLPAYGVYVISYLAPAAPWELPMFVFRSGGWWWVCAAIALFGLGFSIRSWAAAGKLLLGLAMILALCTAVYFYIPFDRAHKVAFAGWNFPFLEVTDRPTPKPVKMLWMPRYLGGSFPAVLIAAVLLIRRLPIGLRQVVLLSVVAVNLANFGTKVAIDPEPPVRQAMRELLAEVNQRNKEPSRLIYVQAAFGTGFEPGTGNLTGVVGRYHFSTMSGIVLTPLEFRGFGGVIERTLQLRVNLRQNAVRGDLAANPTVRSVVLWERGSQRSGDGRDPLGRILGPGWTLGSTELFNTYDHWTWQRLAQIRRFEYVRQPSTRPGSPPETAPSTRRVP